MSVLKTNAAQIGQSITTTNNFTMYQPASPDGTVRLGNGNAGSVTDLVVLNSAGNLGLGVTPSAWGAGKAFEVGYGGNAVWNAGANNLQITSNAYYNGGWKYSSSTTATAYQQTGGVHQWLIAPSGTAGAGITFTQAMTLDASGNLGIGTTSLTSGKLSVTAGTAATGNSLFLSNIDGAYNPFLQVQHNGVNGIKIANSSSSGGTAGNLTISPYANCIFETGSTERMRIDTSGNVGIGTSSPSTILHVKGNSPHFTFQNTAPGSTSSPTWSGINFNAYDNSARSFIESSDVSANNNFSDLRFGTTGSERMRIDSSGNLLVGTTSQLGTGKLGILANANNDGLVVRGTGGVYGTGYAYVSTSSTGYAGYFTTSSGTAGSISVSGTTTGFNTSSDYRLKENIQPMQNALAVVQQLNPVTYTWKADGSDGQGFIAHELQDVVPDCVTGEKDAVDKDGNPIYQGIDTSFLVATLTKAIQELEARVKQLEAK